MDPETQTIEMYALVESEYRLAGRALGHAPASPPPPDLAFVPASLWP